MISIHVYDAGKSAIAKIKKQMQDELDKQFSAKVRLMFRDLVKVTPQWSGNYAANWYISEDPNFAGYTATVMKGHTRYEEAGQAGDTRGTAPSINRSNFQSKKLNYTKPVYFINNTPTLFEEGSSPTKVTGYSQPYPGADYPEITEVRKVNLTKVTPDELIGSGVVLSNYLKAKYG